MKLVLVRHGETDWNKAGKFQGHYDIPLNHRGLAQARQTASAVVNWKHRAIYSSPLSRTMQVAEEISRLGGQPIVPIAALKELDLGDLEGVTGQEMRQYWPDIYHAWRADPSTVTMPNGESISQLQQRAWQALEPLETAHEADDAMIVVSHNFAIRAIISKVVGIPLSNFHCMSLSLSSISVVESTQQGRRLTLYNSTCHLSTENQD